MSKRKTQFIEPRTELERFELQRAQERFAKAKAREAEKTGKVLGLNAQALAIINASSSDDRPVAVVSTTLSVKALEKLDRLQAQHNVNRATMLRRLVMASLAMLESSNVEAPK